MKKVTKRKRKRKNKMEKKIRITYNGFGIISAIIIEINGWYDLENSLNMNGIDGDQILKIELVIEASEANTFDKTKE